MSGNLSFIGCSQVDWIPFAQMVSLRAVTVHAVVWPGKVAVIVVPPGGKGKLTFRSIVAVCFDITDHTPVDDGPLKASI